jgi:hypothetical protein
MVAFDYPATIGPRSASDVSQGRARSTAFRDRAPELVIF